MAGQDDTQPNRPKPRRSGFIKGLPNGQKWTEDAERDTELQRARSSAYYWWWQFLAESKEYRRAVSGAREEPYASMARDFGKTWNANFDSWWIERGRDLFSKQMVLPQVRALEHGEVVNLEQMNRKLVLEIPLTMRRRTVIRKVNEFLNKKRGGEALRVMRHSTAQRQLNPESRMRARTMELLHRIWVHKKANPDQTLHELGEELRLSMSFMPRSTDTPADKSYKARCMTIIVQRYLRKAETLIYWAARGKFPCVDKCPLEGQQRTHTTGAP